MRGKKSVKRPMVPDPQFNNPLVGKFINMVMVGGKKSVAQKIVYGAFVKMSEKSKLDPIELFDLALKNVIPAVETKSRRVGGANYQVPMPVTGDRKYALAFRWILGAARGRKGRPMAEKLADELLLASKGEGDAVKKKLDVQRMAEANRAFAHFAN